MLNENEKAIKLEIVSTCSDLKGNQLEKKTIHYRAKLSNAKLNARNKSIVYLDKFRSDVENCLSPKHTENIARFTGRKLKAADGRFYPRPSKYERHSADVARNRRKQYHRLASQSDTLLFALSALDKSWDPAELAVHMKKHAEVGMKLDLTLEWLTAFSTEFYERGTTTRQEDPLSSQ